MFNERMSLKLRLEELDAREIRVAKECRDERESIYERLRKLDEQDTLFPTTFPVDSSDKESQEVIPINELTKIVQEKQSEIKKEMTQEAVQIFENVISKEVLPMINGLKELVTKERSEKDQLLKSLEESKSMIKQFEQIFGSYAESEKKNEVKNEDTVRKGKKNEKIEVKGRNKREREKDIDYTHLHEEALSILKQHTASVQSSKLKKEVETRTGVKIQNMTTFMQRLMKKDERIEKPYRGEYFYRREGHKEADSLEEQEIAVTKEKDINEVSNSIEENNSIQEETLHNIEE
ncbi:hypothetical protein CVD28_03675 [Bacillus sp. M6-12]|uniref:Rok-like winged helix domain-containing protein n=1 Tax=Bacillus sp. M6-12 TaxID=2054166 RepID=UPI000C785203|nr:hypothetical protein [Bacillus sp. M6-12]PLS19527.1 hypothetical protein CVD28_03675 [Bacillus sp. M6-12]